MKFPLENLNPDSCFLHPINTYTCKITIASKMCDDTYNNSSYYYKTQR